MVRIFFAACAVALFVWGPAPMQPSPKATPGVGLTKVDRVYLANAIARIGVDVR